MLPTINGKSFLEVTEDDLRVLVENADYRVLSPLIIEHHILSFTLLNWKMRNMFNQFLSLEKEIYKYRSERIAYYQGIEDDEEHSHSQFLMLHIISETFMDLGYDEKAIVFEDAKERTAGRWFLFV